MASSDVFSPIENFPGRQRREATIEETYQKKTQLEHVIIRPDTYIGSVELHKEVMWVIDSNLDKMVQREITYVPGLYKIFDEILVNAADNKQRDPTMTCIKVTINQNMSEITVWNDGRGIPVVEHKVEKMFVPTLIFGTLLTSSNYDDSEKKVTGGRNGYGAKLCNIFSKRFTVETSCREYGKLFKQTWEDNMQKSSKPIVSACTQADYTCVKFIPDLDKFGMSVLDDDIVALMSRRAYDVAGSTKGVKVYLNGKRLTVSGFRDYIDLYTKNRLDENQQPLKIVYEQCNPRWELAVTISDKGFQQVSFVNSIATTKGGRHIDHALEGIVAKVVEVIKKDVKKSGFSVKPFQVKNHLWIFVNCLIENPTFDSQTKENMTLPVKSFGSKCTPSEKFLGQVVKCGILECVTQWLKFKALNQLNSQCSSSKHSKLKGIPKLEDANEAGTKNSHSCTLILTEGDSAKTLAVSGFSVVGRDYYGVFPLKGKMLNVREATHAQICKNEEIINLLKIIGLQYKRRYESVEELRTLRYGKLMIMADQDQDGSHIKGLVINFIHHNWPSLIRQNFLEEFITPIVKVSKGKEVKAFFSLPEYEEWKAQTHNWCSWKVKYYKGLGTSTAKEAKEYFSDMYRHRIRFHYAGNEDDCALDLAFSKKKVEDRKEWLSDWMTKRKRQRLDNIPEAYLYEKNTKAVSFKDFVDKELILFSNMDNERSIPSLVDGLKPGQRKVMFTCFKRNDKREVKVAQLAGSVAEISAYHHGEASLMGTIINLAHDFVGSNNINLLLPVGQFGTRLQGGKDAASARYIFTMLNPVTRALFHESDIPCLNFLFDDNQRIEPEWYCPVLPTVLINGAEGIGTGWSTKVPNYNPRELVDNIKRMLNDEEPHPMKPWYKNFRGVIEQVSPERFVCFGNVAQISPNTIEITELPIGIWTQTYKESVLEPMLYGSELKQPLITDFKEYHTDTTVRFVIKVKPENMASVLQSVHTVFKLQSSISTSSMVLFDAEGCLRRFENAEDILKEFYTVRLSLYAKRKAHLIGLLTAQAKRLENQARFVMEKIEGIIKIENVKKKVIVDQLVDRRYDPDPLRKWKQQQEADTTEEDSESIASDLTSARLSDFDYLLSMAVLKFSEEEKDKLLGESSQKLIELNDLKQKSPKDLWNDDLELFLSELDKQEKREKEDAKLSFNESKTHWKPGSSIQQKQILPSENGVPLMPVITQEFRQKVEKALQVKMRQRAIKTAKATGDKIALDKLRKRSAASKVKNKYLSPAKKSPFREQKTVSSNDRSSKSITDWISTGKPHDAVPCTKPSVHIGLEERSRPIGSGEGIRKFLKPMKAVIDTDLTNAGTSESRANESPRRTSNEVVHLHKIARLPSVPDESKTGLQKKSSPFIDLISDDNNRAEKAECGLVQKLLKEKTYNTTRESFPSCKVSKNGDQLSKKTGVPKRPVATVEMPRKSKKPKTSIMEWLGDSHDACPEPSTSANRNTASTLRHCDKKDSSVLIISDDDDSI